MISIDWSSIHVPHSYDRETIGAGDVFMTIARQPSERNANSTYTLERGLLDYIGENRFIHKTFEVELHTIHNPIYIEFSATDVKFGTRMHHK